MGKFSLSLFFPSLSLAIPQFGLLSHVSSLRLNLRAFSPGPYPKQLQPTPPCSAPTCWWWMRASGLLSLLGVAVRHIICGFYLYIYFSSQLCCPLRFQNSPQTRWWERFPVFGNFYSFKTPFSGWISIPNSFVSLFISYIFSPFKDNGLPFWVPDVLCQHSEIVFWNLLSIQCSFDEFVRRKSSFCSIPPPP